MYQHLSADTILNDRYKIKRLLSSVSYHAVYLAKDIKVTEKSWLVKEYIPPSSDKLTEEELKAREKQFYESLDVVVNFEHASLPKTLDFFQDSSKHYLVVESVDGVTLQSICDMSVDPLSEKQIIEWGIQICEAISYLHSRPKPFVHSMLDPSHIMVDETGRIKLVNLGFNRFFDPDLPPYAFSKSISDIADDFYELGKTFYYLFTKSAFTPEKLLYDIPNTTPQINKIIQRCLSEDPERNYREANELKKDLDRIINPQKHETIEDRPPEKKILPFQYLLPNKEFIDRIFYAIFSQNIVHFALEVAGVIILAVILWLYLHPGWNYIKKSPVIMCASKGELWTIDPNNFKLLDRKILESQISGIECTKDGSKVYLSDFTSSKTIVMNSLHNQIELSIPVDKNPSKIFLSGNNLFCINEPTNNISLVLLNKKEMTALIPTGGKPVDIAFSPKRSLLYISESTVDAIHIIDPFENRINETISIPGGVGPIALSPDENKLYIAKTKWDGITILKLDDNSVAAEIENAGIKKASCLKFSPNGNSLYILDKSSCNLLRLSMENNTINILGKMGKSPIDLNFDNNGRIWIANYGSHNISVYNIRYKIIENTINTPRNPCSIKFIP